MVELALLIATEGDTYCPPSPFRQLAAMAALEQRCRPLVADGGVVDAGARRQFAGSRLAFMAGSGAHKASSPHRRVHPRIWARVEEWLVATPVGGSN